MNLRELLTGTLSRLRYVYRWSTFRNAHPESVAEHCYYVALYSLFICEWLRSSELALSTCYSAIAKALCHDLEETLTGDMPRTFKHSSADLSKELARVSGTAMDQVVYNLDLDKQSQDRLTAWWRDCKSNDVAGSIVAFADYLSVLSYLLQEKLDSNHSVKFHLTTMREYYEEFSSKRYDFIRKLVDETRPFVKDLTGEQSKQSL